jgi:uncharacterized C2H2 Zn-finger protein
MCEQEFLSLQAYEKHVCDIVHFCPRCEHYFRRHHDFRYHKTKSAICQKGKVSTVRVPMTPDLRLYFESEELKKLRTVNGLSRPSLQDQPDVKDMPNPLQTHLTAPIPAPLDTSFSQFPFVSMDEIRWTMSRRLRTYGITWDNTSVHHLTYHVFNEVRPVFDYIIKPDGSTEKYAKERQFGQASWFQEFIPPASSKLSVFVTGNLGDPKKNIPGHLVILAIYHRQFHDSNSWRQTLLDTVRHQSSNMPGRADSDPWGRQIRFGCSRGFPSKEVETSHFVSHDNDEPLQDIQGLVDMCRCAGQQRAKSYNQSVVSNYRLSKTDKYLTEASLTLYRTLEPLAAKSSTYLSLAAPLCFQALSENCRPYCLCHLSPRSIWSGLAINVDARLQTHKDPDSRYSLAMTWASNAQEDTRSQLHFLTHFFITDGDKKPFAIFIENDAILLSSAHKAEHSITEPLHEVTPDTFDRAAFTLYLFRGFSTFAYDEEGNPKSSSTHPTCHSSHQAWLDIQHGAACSVCRPAFMANPLNNARCPHPRYGVPFNAWHRPEYQIPLTTDVLDLESFTKANLGL